jgi:hypothetical protein
MSPRDWKPGELLEASGAYWSSCALHAAVKLELFSRLADERLTAAQIAGRVNGAVRGVEPLLNAMAAFGLLVKTDGTYSNSDAARLLLCQASPAYIGHMLLHHHHLVESWSRLDEAVLAGRPVRERSSVRDEQWRESFLMGMFNMAMAVAPRLVPAIDLSSRQRLLDLGGGPGTYAIHFCLAHPGLTADVFDLPTSRPFAERTIARFDLGGRVAFLSGDYHTDEISGPYDAAWLSHILHAEGPVTCREIVGRAVKALEPGGMIMVHEFILNDDRTSPPFPALFSLNMLTGTPEGRSYTVSELTSMLADAGVSETRLLPFTGPTDSRILAGTTAGRR